MDEYFKQAINDFDPAVTKTGKTPARRTLFNVNGNSPLLNETEKDKFHSVAAKLLYTSVKCRLDIQLPVSCLCTKVRKATRQDQYKLLRILQYLNGRPNDKLILGVENLRILKTWVGTSYACHDSAKSHTGGSVSLGRGMIVSKSSKQRLVTKSSTEA